MHRALLISEVVQEICAALNESSLPAVAQSCRALYDPALDKLWRDLYSIYPFVYLLTPENGQQTLSSRQWSTLCTYSARTRSLYVCMIDDVPYFDRFPCLSDPPNSTLVFPNLRTLAWYPDNHLEMLPLFCLLCGPSLTSLSAEFATDPTSLAVVASLGTTCPYITDVSISASLEIPNEALSNALSTSVRQWKYLAQVSCDDLDVSAMHHLSRATHLTSLTMCASKRLFACEPDHSGSFSRLEHLHLYAGVLSTIMTCLSGLRLALHEFRIDLFDTEELSASPFCLRDALTAFGMACSPAHLTRFDLCVVHPHISTFDTGIGSTLRDLHPLFSFTHLRVVSFEGLVSFSLSNDDIDVLASAWPNIEELALSTYVDYPGASLPTVRSLVSLTHACPKLCSLALVVDMTHPLDIEKLGRSDVLAELCFGNAPIGDPVVVAHVLARIYPALRQVDLSVWNKAPLDRLPRRDRYEACWGIVNLELERLERRQQALKL